LPTGESEPPEVQSARGSTWVSSVTAPVAETLSCQQLPTPCSSQEKSTPLGWTTPAGWKPRRFFV
jgi:hypothetical protein